MSQEPTPLNDCGCCEGPRPLTPASVENAPGLPALRYRVGTHGSFKTTMQTGLSTNPVLRALTTRADADAGKWARARRWSTSSGTPDWSYGEAWARQTTERARRRCFMRKEGGMEFLGAHGTHGTHGKGAQ